MTDSPWPPCASAPGEAGTLTSLPKGFFLGRQGDTGIRTKPTRTHRNPSPAGPGRRPDRPLSPTHFFSCPTPLKSSPLVPSGPDRSPLPPTQSQATQGTPGSRDCTSLTRYKCGAALHLLMTLKASGPCVHLGTSVLRAPRAPPHDPPATDHGSTATSPPWARSFHPAP